MITLRSSLLVQRNTHIGDVNSLWSVDQIDCVNPLIQMNFVSCQTMHFFYYRWVYDTTCLWLPMIWYFCPNTIHWPTSTLTNVCLLLNNAFLSFQVSMIQLDFDCQLHWCFCPNKTPRPTSTTTNACLLSSNYFLQFWVSTYLSWQCHMTIPMSPFCSRHAEYSDICPTCQVSDVGLAVCSKYAGYLLLLTTS